MAPRRRSRAGHDASSNLAAVTIADLPVDLLQNALGFLDLCERQRTALMSRRFAAAACSPLLLRRVDLPLLDSSSALESLAAWLARHGQHVRSLRYRCGPAHERFAQGLVSGTATCLTAAGAAGQLQDLCVYAALDELHTGWLCTMRSLTRLQLSATPLSISPAIRGLTALQSLTLVGEVDFKAGARLPTAITRLSVECDESGEDLPAQIAQLPQLQRLLLAECDYSADGLSQLSALGSSLTRLDVCGMEGPASGLEALSRLQHLQLEVENGAAVEAARDALPHLTRLTCLLVGVPGLKTLLPALSDLPELQLCQLDPAWGEDDVQLPSGPWLRNLRWLSTGVGLLLSSTAALQAAGHLECISIIASSVTKSPWRSWEATAFFAWLARHPPLRQLSIVACPASPPFNLKAFADKLTQLRRRRPALLVDFPGFGEESESLFEYLDRTQPF